MEVDDKELWERLTVVEQSTKSAHHRLDSLDRLTESVHILATETKAMREDVSDITSRVLTSVATGLPEVNNEKE